jgi:hypothetical protein
MKLAVNAFLITMVTGLAEAVHFAEQTWIYRSCWPSSTPDQWPVASRGRRPAG